MKAFLLTTCIIGVILTLSGYLFLMQRWPYGKEMMVSGPFLFLGSSAWLLYRKVKKQ